MTSIRGIRGSIPRRPRLPAALGIVRTARGLSVTSLCVAFLVLGGSGAGAVWNGFGTGAGSAGTETTEPVVLSPGTPTTALLPGARADVALTVSNPNAARLHIGSLSLDREQGTRGYAVDAGHPDCDVSSVRFSDQSNGGAGWTVPGKVGTTHGSASLTLTDALGMATSAPDGCQGAVFTVYLAAGP